MTSYTDRATSLMESGMRTILLGLCFAFGAATASAAADGGLVKAGDFHNVHIRVPDPPKAAEWYVKSLGATAGRAPQLIFFGKTLIEFVKDDLDEQMKVLSANGAKIVTPVRDVPGLFKLGFIEDPWGTKIEVVQDTEQLGFHHVHLSVPDPPNVLSLYQEAFGGERAKLKGRIDALRYGGVWLLAAASAAGEKPAGSAGRAIYNLAWTVPSVDDAVAALKAKGLKVTVEPRSLPTVRYAFVEDPNGILIEFIQTLKP